MSCIRKIHQINIEMIRLVIFDMDGLLLDTERATYRAFMERAAAWGYEPAKEQYLQFLGLNAEAIQKKYFEFFDKDIDAPELYRQVGERKMEILRTEGMPVKKGVRELLDVLEKAGIKKAVASGSDPDTIKENLENAGLLDRFDLTLSTEKVKRGKPYPDIFLEICRQMGTDSSETLVLEDAESGVRAALAGGISVINVPDMIRIPEELEKQCMDVKDSLLDVIPFIEKQTHF